VCCWRLEQTNDDQTAFVHRPRGRFGGFKRGRCRPVETSMLLYNLRARHAMPVPAKKKCPFATSAARLLLTAREEVSPRKEEEQAAAQLLSLSSRII
jgi:hypothetical protein